jgi:uncharacterized membrane protein YjjB (DUF3815 family)
MIYLFVIKQFCIAVITMTKPRKMSWAGKVACMASMIVLVIKPGGEETEKTNV